MPSKRGKVVFEGRSVAGRETGRIEYNVGIGSRFEGAVHGLHPATVFGKAKTRCSRPWTGDALDKRSKRQATGVHKDPTNLPTGAAHFGSCSMTGARNHPKSVDRQILRTSEIGKPTGNLGSTRAGWKRNFCEGVAGNPDELVSILFEMYRRPGSGSRAENA